LRKAFGEDLFEKNIIHPIYLACFCEDDNLPSQWGSYGQSGGGYSLAFRVPVYDPPTHRGFKPEPKTYASTWMKVEYDRNEQARKCSAILDPLLTIFDDPIFQVSEGRRRHTPRRNCWFQK
jgi:hypothetical protein